MGQRKIAAFAVLMLWPLVGWTQAPAHAERIEVTGSNLPQIAAETALPLQTITARELRQAGVQSAQDILDRVSANMSYGAWTEARGVGTAVPGLTGASLRGLGSERTLILLNGRRLAPYAISGGSSVDISAIPLAAIERIEVLKEGASAIYGTDAIGGVINFILRSDYRGAEAQATYLATQHGGGNQWRASAAAGYGDLARDRFNVLLTVDHARQEALASADREFSRTSYLPEYGFDRTSPNTWPANIPRPGGPAARRNPTIALTGATAGSCVRPFSFPTVTLPLSCNFDYASVIESIPQTEKTNAVGRVTWRLPAALELYAEASFYRSRFRYLISPTPVSTAFTNTRMTLPPSSPFYPVEFARGIGLDPAQPIFLAYRTVELGGRLNEPVSEQWRAVAGVKAARGDWDLEASGSFNANRQVDRLVSGYLSEARFGPLLRSGAINPFGANTAAALDLLRAAQLTGETSRNEADHAEATVKASGTPFEIAAGPVALALGGSARRERLEILTDAVLQPAPFFSDIVGGGAASPSVPEARRTVATVFAEAGIPLAPSLDANLAVRHDRYGDFGGTTNPRAALRWEAARGLVLRGSYGAGFRAPTLADLHEPEKFDLDGEFDDPLRCRATGTDADCARVFVVKRGGNPNLRPETSRQLNVGMVLQPSRPFSLSLDYYRVAIRDLITVVPVFALFEDYARWAPTHVVRGPIDAATPGLPGPIEILVGTAVNAGEMRTSGIDIDARYRLPATALGELRVSLAGTYVIGFKVREFEAVVSGPGTGWNGAIPRWRHYAAIDWSRGAWGATLSQTFQRSHTEIDPATCTPGTFPAGCSGRRRVGSYETWDIQARFAPFAGAALTAGVRNLFDRAPPRALSPDSFQIGYDPTYADPRGRMFYAGLQYGFR